MKIEIIEHGIVAARPGQMYGWPGMTRVDKNTILVAASERRYHVCPWGREVVIRSNDDGRTWELPQEVYNSELDDRDTNILTLPDGTIFLSGFTSEAFTAPKRIEAMPEIKPRVDRVTERMRRELSGPFSLRSFDGGYNWETQPHPMPTGSHAGPSLLRDGSLIYIGRPDTGRDCMVYDDEMPVFKSADAGLEWHQESIIPSPGAALLSSENHVVETESGRLIAMFRANNTKSDGFLYQCISEDGGKTWSLPRKLDFWGFPPHLLRLEDGSILCAYSHRREPWSIRAIISRNDGDTWGEDGIFTIRDLSCSQERMDFGYPVTVECGNGELLTVYYYSRRNHERLIGPYTGEKVIPEGILYTRWRLQS